MSNYCPAPRNMISIEPDGFVKPCCVYKGESPKATTLESITQAFDNNQKIATELELGNWPKGCKSCLRQEENKVISKRNKLLRKNWSDNFSHLEITFSNSCNLNCIMCDSSYSSKWKEWDRELGRTVFPAWRLPVDPIELAEFCTKLDSIEILGGEPLYDKSFIKFINHLSQQKNQPKVLITTNATIINDKIIDSLSNITDLSLNFSIDGVDQIYKYVRGFDFDTTYANYTRLKQLKNLTYSCIHYTISYANVFNLSNFVKRFQGENLYFDQIVKGTTGIEILPNSVLEKIEVDCIDNETHRESLVNHIEYCKTLENPNYKKIFEFFDKKRNMKILELEPKLND